MSVTEDIKSRLDIVDIIGEQVQLKRAGRSYSGFCPFHQNTRTPSFHVFPDTQTWYCFGACAEGGDVFNFVMKRQGLDFKEALEQLASRAGVTLESNRPEVKKRQAEADRLADLVAAAADYFHQLFLYAPEAEAARKYIDKRGLNDESQAHFKIGFALKSWDALRNHFSAQGYEPADLLAAGLLSENPERGTTFDRFRNRLIIPIRDVRGRIVGFGARTLDPDGVPKYLNSPQTALFDKSRVLFGLDSARHHIREARQVVIVEGYMDVMQAWQAGFRNVVAQMGTALTEQQLRLLKRFTRHFVLALDADVAGANATMRSLSVAREALSETEVAFDARGLIQNEGQLQADIHIVTLPEGNDPDNIIRANPADWPRYLAKAQPVVAYVIDVVTHELDLDDAKAKVAAAQQVLPLLDDIREPVERAHYRRLLAQKLQIDERALDRIPGRAPAPRRRSANTWQPPDGPPPPEEPPRERALTILSGGTISTRLRETNYLRQCVARPPLIFQVDQKLAEVGQGPVGPTDFSLIEDQRLFEHLQTTLQATGVADLTDLWDTLEVPVQERLQALMHDPVPEEHELERKLALSVLDWRLEKIRAARRATEMLLSDQPPQARQEMFGDHRQRLLEFSRHSLQIDRARQAMSSMGRRDN